MFFVILLFFESSGRKKNMNKTLIVFALLGLIAIDAVVLQTKGIGCNLCLDFVKDLETELENDEGNIEQKANKICDKLTHDNSFLDPLCKSLVDNELETIVQGIENKDPPEKICKKIKFCK
uniref:Saposin B-type domain-containing protein n=1 Tax=Panagrolaimus sp. PS1159 TaxID=55785 RepID=A0AC35FUC0_9BILA